MTVVASVVQLSETSVWLELDWFTNVMEEPIETVRLLGEIELLSMLT